LPQSWQIRMHRKKRRGGRIGISRHSKFDAGERTNVRTAQNP
jgi:hypothetical protein